jgi:hypothetical protein
MRLSFRRGDFLTVQRAEPRFPPACSYSPTRVANKHKFGSFKEIAGMCQEDVSGHVSPVKDERYTYRPQKKLANRDPTDIRMGRLKI